MIDANSNRADDPSASDSGSDNTNAYAKFELALEVEDLAERLYRRLAVHFTDNPAARAIFERLAGEEQQHAMRIDLLRKKYMQDPARVPEIALDVEESRQLLDEGAVLMQLLEAGDRSLTLKESARMMVELEQRFSIVHAHAMAEAGDADLRAFFEQLAAQDREHAALLERLRATA